MLEFQDIERPALELPDLQVTDVGVEIDTINFDLQLTVTQNAGAADESDGLRAEFGYATDIFDEETVAGFADRLQRILERVITDPQSRIGDIEILDAYESAELVPVRGEISAAVRTLPDLLTAATDMATARDPGAVALVFEEREVTYLELDAQSNRLARMLIESGVGPESVVALCLPRSIESVLAVWSIAKTGAAFLPVDPGHPAARIEHMLGDSGAGWGITSRAHNAALSGLVPWLVLDDAGFEERLRAYSPSKVTDADRKAPIRIDNPVYLIYTSGSTGTPKGVTVTHRGLSDFALQERETFAATTRSRTLHFSSPSFDASVLELVMAVGAGATMVIVPPTVYGGSELAALLERERVTHCFVTPAALTSVDPDGLTTVGCVVTGGEACPPELVARWAPGRKMFNAYGPTEATVVSSISAALAPNDPVTIGTPTRGFSEVVLDSRLRAVPVGVAGELYLAGPALARGYHRRYPLTATQFVADPFGAPGTRIYRTGDRVRWTPDRRLEYLGRTDAQVKVRGFRIELGEVEVALQTHPRVAQAVTAVWNGDGRDRLIGYVVPDRGASVDPRDVLAHAGKRLPSYMVPAAVVVLDAVPLTVHGKLDRAALPTPDFSSAATPDRPPRTETENLLAALFAQVLGLDSVGVHDSFFELGGDSIMSIQLVARARDAGVIISPRDVFDHKSVAALAESAHLEQDRPEVLAELPGSAVGTVPLSPVAQWMLDRSSGGLRGGGVKRFSQALLLTAPADLTQDLLVRGLQVLLDRHGMLRARLVESDRVMEVLPPGSISAEGLIHRVAVDSVDDERFRALASGELEAAADSLDPAAADMVRVIWFDLADKPDVSTRRGRLLVVIHHLVVDGVSWRILVTDLASVTAQLQAGVTPELPQIGTSFRRWAHGLVEHVGDRSVELDMWITILDGDDPLIGSRPLDPTIDVDDTVDTVTVDISPSATRNLLTTVPAAFHAGMNDGLVTAVALASIGWRRRRGMDTVAALITLEGHGREEGVVPGADLARTVGWFTTLYPVRVDLGAIDVDDALAGGADAGRALKAVKEYVRAIPDHGIGFGMLRYLSGESDPLGRFRSPQISFNYLGRISSSDGTQDWLPVEGNRRLGGTQNPSMPVASVIDINAAVEDHVDGPCLTASFTFPRGVLDRSDIAEFAELWRRALDGLIAHASRPDAGGLTPSDIPLVSVDQQQIERWENDFPGLHDVWSVSPLQAGLMFHASLAATSTDVYTAQLCVELEGAVDSERLRGAGAGLLANHPNLCAAFVYDVNGLPVQLIVDDAVIPWTEVDLSDRGSATDADLERRLDEDRSAPFDLASPPLLRLTLLRTSPTRCVLVVTNHHIVLDGWSIPLLVRELLMRYAADGLPVERAPADLPETPSYRAYLEWLMHRDMETSLAAWEDALEGVDEPTLLAPSTPIAEQLVPEEVGVDLPDSVRDGLGALVQRSGITMNTVIQAAWGVLLSRMLSRDDVVFGVTVSGRSPELSGVENMMGLLINTLPVRVQLDPDETCTQLLARLQSEQTALLDHHYVGLGAIQSVVGTGNLFDTLSVFESYPIDTSGMGGNTDIAGMRVTAVNARDATHYPLTVLSVAEPTLQVSLRYQPAAFDRAAVDTIAQRMSRILAAFAANADTPVGEVDVFVAGERGLVVGGWDGVGVVVGGLTLVDVLDGRFAGVGGGGLVCGGVVLSWGEFDVRVNRFARFLISLGVGPESRVCVALSRSVELLVAVFAVVRAGGVFVPVDVGAPVERVGFVVGVVDPVVVLSRVGDGGCLPVGVGFVDVGCVDVSGFSGGPVGMGDRLGVLLPEHAVYVMFTSGSTGRPKGVVVSHAGVVNRLLWMQGEFPLGVGDVVLQKTPVSFDVSVWELFWPLMVGARLVVADPGGHRDPVYLVGVIERWGVSVVHFVPSMLEVFVGELSVGELGVGCSGLRRVFVSGEGLSSVLAGRFAGVCGAELVNLYGPTEASVDVTFHVVEGVVGVGVPIGRPVWNTRVLVLDSRLRPVPVGVVGELYVGGVQVARGYEGRVDLTVGRFVADPVSGVVGARVYRTGDVVRWGCGGVLEFVGRKDFQVKVRGQRVELGEVEAVLAAQVGVAGAVVVLRSGVGGDFLVGFVVGEVGVVVDEVVVLEGARRSLPGFMVPSVVVVLGEFPVTVHGKLDRKALPDVNFEPQALQYVAPRTPIEETVAAIFDDLLGTSTVGVNDDFFALGGNSLSAARLVARVNSVLGERINIRDVFDASTVAALAELAQCRGGEGAKPALTPRGMTTDIPLSPAQERMWFANQFAPESAAYNVACALRLDGPVNVSALHAAFVDVVERHESLRTVFPLTDNGPRQVIMSTSQVVSDLVPILVQGEEELRERSRQIASVGFDVTQQVPMRATVLRRDDQVHSHVLVIVIHHIAADGFSTVPLARDLMSAYSSRVNGEAPQWAPLGIQYADYALWQRGWLGSESDSRSLISKQLGYWAENLAGAPEVLDIPTDRPRVDVRSLRRGRIRFVFGPKVHAGVVALSRKRNATVFMVVHAALAVLLARLSDEDDVAVGTPIAGRGERELDDLVGMFVNTLVLRTAVDRGATFGDFLDQVRNVDLSAFIHADVPFERVVEIVNPSRSTAYSPLFQVMLEFQDIERPALELPDLQVTDVGVEIDTINFDLQLTVTQNAGAADESDGLRAEFGYATDIFDEETVAGFADRLQRILERVITDPQSRIGDIEILDAYESAELVPVRGEISAAVRTLPDLLTAATDMATARDPGAVALVFEEREVTYLELDAQSNRLARMLIESGVGPESVVALCLPRSIESVLAVWSIAKTGAAFLPVDPGHPAARIEHMLGDSGAGWGITSRAHNAALSGLVPWLVLDDAGFEERLRAYSPSKVTDADRKAPIRIDNPVYLIYTSGSTGTPKGVTVTHRGLSDFALQERETFAATTRSRTLHFSSPSFDASVLELVMAVGAGATMVIVPPTVYGGSELAALLERERVTHCFVTPAALTSVDPDGLTTVGCVVTGGEACPPELVARWAPGRKMFNAYGPTEATVVSSISAALAPNDPVTIGTPTRGFSEVVLDSRLRAVPVGVAGELYLAGPALARGYHRRYPLTATQFVADPFGAPGTRIYRTGDRVRWTPDRRLEYLGRTDAQVKVRGFRIELGEVEVALQTHPRVAQAVTAVWNGDGRDRLIGYVVPDRGASVDPRDVLAHAGKRLPSYMVPAAVVVLDAVPLTVHGKLDRAALPTPDFSSAATPDRPPRTETENLLAALFAQVLGLDSVGVHDSFFELGGDSIMSIQLVARARDAGVIISPRDVFDHKSVAALAESAHLEQDRPEVLAELPGSAVGTVPLSPVAQWMLDRSSGGLRGGGVKRFSQALLLTAPADLTQDLLVRGLQVLLDRHGMLRARLVESDRVMEVLPPGSISAEGLIHRVAVDSVDDERFRALASGELEAAADSLDPAAADMVRVIWFDLADKPDVSTRRGRLLVVIHHLVVDGVSWRILVTDLASVTAQLQAGVTPELPQIGTSFRRWAHGLVEHVGDRSVELDMWITILDGDDPLIGSRPLDPTIDVDDTVDTVTVDISPSATRNLLTTVPAAFHAGVNDGLVTAVALASIGWRRRRGMDTVAALITLEGHGREEGVVPGADLARTVGWFTTLYPVRVDLGAIDVDDALAGGADAGRALKAVKEYVRAIPDHGIGFGMLRYLSGESDPLGRFRSPQISFNYLGRISSSDGTQDWLPVEGNRRLGGTQNPSMPVASVIDINAAVEDHVDGPCLTASFTFPRGVLDRSDIAEFAELWRRALDGLIAHASRPDAGGLTPSDIPLVSVDQQQIERWENDFPGLHDVWSVSPLQAGLMFHASLAATSTDVYTAQLCVELEGAVDSERLRGAGAGLLANHPNLCAAFVYDVNGLPVQLIVDDAVIPWTEVDLSDRGSATDADLERRLDEDRSAPFDLASPPLLRLTLLRTSPTRCVLVVTNHHIVLDGWSIPLLVRELLMRYAADGLPVERAPADLPETPSYRAYLEWLMHRDMETSLAAWEDALEGVDEPTLLAPSTPIAEQLVPEEVGVDLPDSVRDGLGALVQRSGITMNTVIQAAWGVLLSRMLSRDDVVFGVTVSGRSPELSGVENMMGLLINTLPVRVQLDPDETCTQLLARLQSEQTALLDHHYVGLGAIQSVVGTGNLFDTLSVFESYPIDTSGMGGNTDIAGMRVTAVNARDATHYPLTVLSVAEPTLQVSLRYQPAAFDRAAVDTIAQRMSRILAAFAANADTPVGEVDVFVAGERGLVVGGWDGVGVVVGGLTLVDVLDGRFAGVGGGGLVCGGVVLSWGEFDVRVNRFARFLISLGVGPESRVCVALSRSVELLVAVFAVVRAGGVFVPVDVGAPVERVGFVVGVVDPVVVLSRVGDGGCLPVGVGFVDVGCVDVSGFSGGPVGMGDRLGVLLPEHAVYVMFTSGSTGRPKGVVVSHAGVVNRLLWMQGEFPLGVGDVVLQKTPVSFDVSVWELFWPLMVGARLVVADPGGHRDPVYLVGVIERWGVSVVHFVPSMLEVFVGELSVGELGVGCSGLRRVFVSGEGLSSVLAGRFAGVCGAELVNLYGPTEASVDVTFHVVEGVVGVGVPIGRPVWNTRVLVLDSRLRPVPVGVVGELYVGGVQVARGYEGRVDLTVGRFVADPVSGVVGARVYRTGDVVRWGCGGVLEFVGRTDFQVKVRGQRVELGEVEAVLAAQVGVAGAVVVLRSGVGGDFLVGFVVGEVGVVVDEVVVLEGARRSLPGFMVPSVVVVLGEFPVTVHGKLDRKALPDVNFEPQALQYVAPRTPIEETVAAIFDDLLGTSTVGVNDDFFALGGNSLSAARLVARVNSVLGERINIRDVFDASTVAALAELAQCRGGEGAKPALTPRGYDDRYPTFTGAGANVFANQFAPESAAYNVACALRLDGPVNVSALHAAFVDVVERHESLRTVFPLTDNGPRQVIMSTSQVVSDLVPILVQGEEELRERSRADRFGWFRRHAAGPDARHRVAAR